MRSSRSFTLALAYLNERKTTTQIDVQRAHQSFQYTTSEPINTSAPSRVGGSGEAHWPSEQPPGGGKGFIGGTELGFPVLGDDLVMDVGDV